MKIDISQEDFGTLCICALRYCHGRKTYMLSLDMPSLVRKIVLDNKEKMCDVDRFAILADKGFQQKMNLWGEDIDKTDWMKFYEEMEG